MHYVCPICMIVSREVWGKYRLPRDLSSSVKEVLLDSSSMISLVSYEQAESRQRLILLRFGPIQARGDLSWKLALNWPPS